MSLYLDSLDGNGYVLQGSTPVSGALFDSAGTWTVGRGYFNGNISDWTDGRIDEVRIHDTALDPSLFLNVPEPATALLLLLGAGLLAVRRRRR